jgi:phage terminase small subunit
MAEAKRKRPLTDLQKRFVQEYLIDLNATAAARRAGYSEKTASRIGPELLGKTCVAEAIAAEQSKLLNKLGIKAKNVLQEYERLAFSDIGDILDFSGVDPKLRPANEIPKDARRAIASMKVKRYREGRGENAREVEITEFKLWPKLDALGKLAEHLGVLKPDTSNRSAVQDDKHLARLDAVAFYRAVRDNPQSDLAQRLKAQQSIDRLLGLVEHAPRNLEAICEQLGISLETLRQLVAGDLSAGAAASVGSQPAGEVSGETDPVH